MGSALEHINEAFVLCVLPELEETFPSHCMCSGGTHLTCSNSALSNVPLGIPANTSELIITHSGIQRISVGDLNHLDGLIGIDLGHNRIATIEEGSFQNLTRLERLLLTSNNLVLIEADTFGGLNNLQWLILNENHIRYISAGAFDGVPLLCLLSLQGNELTMQEPFPVLLHVRFVDLRDNMITRLGSNTFSNASTVSILLLDNNEVNYIEAGAFSSLRHLTQLDLTANNINAIDAETFANQAELVGLSLGDNPLSYIPAGTFNNLQELQSLNLTELHLERIDHHMFAVLPQLKFIYFSSFEMCRFAPQVRVCEPKGDGISSFTDLLGSPVLRAFVWIVSLTTCLANLIVLFFRMLFKETQSVPSLFVKNLAVCDYLMGLYLLSVGAHDLLYRGYYYRHALSWITSWGCQLGGVVAMISSEVSILILTTMSVERLVAITMPYVYSGLSLKSAHLAIFLIWIIGLSISIIPLIPTIPTLTEFYSSNGVCFPLHIHDPYLSGWQYSAFVFLGINAAAMVVVIMAYAIMFVNIRRTQAQCAGMHMDVSFAKRFFLIVSTDALCWIPIIIIKVLALVQIQISDELYGWLVVLVLPVNSALNPIIYSLSTPTFQRKLSQSIPEPIRASFSHMVTRRFSALSHNEATSTASED